MNFKSIKKYANNEMNFNSEEKDVYLIRATFKDGSFQYKIGVSKHPTKRLLEIQTANPNNLELLKTFHSTIPYLVETSLQNFFRLNNIEGEWFELSDNDVDNFETTCKRIEDNLKIIQSGTLFS